MNSFNFTVAETTPFDVEVAVDPEMLGKVYESLVNLTTEEGDEGDERGEAGIFYTPRVEIDLMCRLSLVDYLSNHLGSENKHVVNRVVFAFTEDEKSQADVEMLSADLWGKVNSLLREITVLDPACGSGSFLVGMLLVLDDLQERANRILGESESAYERRKRIIGHSLYGVDCKEWAVHMAELRLWLQLVVETHLEQWELMARPLLPNLTFKVRPGDSLVQEIGNVNFCLHSKRMSISPALKGRLTRLKGDKLHFYRNEDKGTFRTEESLKNEEMRLFQDILSEKRKDLEHRIHIIRDEKLPSRQHTLAGIAEDEAPDPKRTALEEELKLLSDELGSIDSAQNALKHSKSVPFVWDIAFVEVFEGDKHGFDIVIGNPPYVRQEKICDPHERWNKLLYKAKLRRSAYSAYPGFFGYKPQKDTDPMKPERAVSRKIDGKSDLYVFFYFHGLSLLNDKGSFCFITSNSWLDVAYGADLQEFLLRQGHVKLIIDNREERSFEDADINTVIALLAPPCAKKDCGLGKTARFATFKLPFEAVVSFAVFAKIEQAAQRVSTPEFRVVPISQDTLLAEGLKALEDDGTAESSSKKSQVYKAEKWGGKYLRAPDIYWAIVEQAGDRLVSLGTLADVQRGFTSGANDFFYVQVVEEKEGIARIRCDDGTEHLIEAEYVEDPVLVKAKEITRPYIYDSDLRYRLVKLDDRAGTRRHAREYIAWGESLSFHKRPTTKNRKPWYKVGDRDPAQVLVPIGHKRRPVVGIETAVNSSDNLVEVRPHRAEWCDLIAGSVLSTFTILLYEILGRANFGQGLLKTQTYEIEDILIPDPRHRSTQSLEEALQAMGSRAPLMIYDDIRLEDRRILDLAFLEAAGVNDERERWAMVEELQDTTCRMIWRRMAKSGNSREARMSYDDWLASGEPFGEVEEEAE